MDYLLFIYLINLPLVALMQWREERQDLKRWFIERTPLSSWIRIAGAALIWPVGLLVVILAWSVVGVQKFGPPTLQWVKTHFCWPWEKD